MNGNDLVVRRSTGADARGMAEVWLRSYAAAPPGVRRAHTDQEVRDWFREVVVLESDCWVAVNGGAVVGLLVLDQGHVEQLYVDPPWWRRGVGGRLMELAKRQCPMGLELWTFQVNEPAQRFYEHHGFTAVERTDGRENEEHEPDIRYAWRPGPG